MSNWYEEFIEPEIRETVRLLRDNGINTECSCGHKMYIQFQIFDCSEILTVDRLLFNSGHRDYYIECSYSRRDGHPYHFAIVHFTVNGRFPVQEERQAAMEQYKRTDNNQ